MEALVAWRASLEKPVVAAATALAVLLAVLLLRGGIRNRRRTQPPFVPYWLPMLGSMFAFGIQPVEFLLDNYRKYGEIFTILLFGRKMTYFMTPEAADYFFNARHEDVSAELAYAPLTVPVFGKDVVYDVPYAVLVEQKKSAGSPCALAPRMIKSNLSPDMFRHYVPRIEHEVVEYTKDWGTNGIIDVNKVMAELTILTASSCLMGDEIRKRLSSDVAQLYADLDGGFTPINFLLPNVPFPANARRDAAQIKLRDLFIGIMNQRRQHADQEHEDMLNTLMNARYKSGEMLQDHQVANMMIALLMAGQHTSSATLAWTWSFLSQSPAWQSRLLAEQLEVQGGALHALDFETVDELKLADLCVRETLRLNPPLVTVMRQVVHDVQYKGYTIPAGHFICVSPSAIHRLPEVWTNPNDFDPERFQRNSNADEMHKFAYIPFGAGRHKCIGETFAHLQVKTVISALVRLFEFELDGPPPKGDYTSMIALPQGYRMRYRRRAN